MLGERIREEQRNFEIPFSDVQVDNYVTLVQRSKPDEWIRIKVCGVMKVKDEYVISPYGGGSWTAYYTSKDFKVVAKRDQ